MINLGSNVTRWLRRGIPALLVWATCSVSSSHAGYVERVIDENTGANKTIIHLSLFDLPDASRIDAATRADVAVVRRFAERYPSIVAERYRERYQADPDRYGTFNWEHVEIRLQRFSGIQVEGVESDLLAIAGGMAPDVLYVNFRKSDTYIQQGFLYPLDRSEDGYLTSMTENERADRVNEKIWPVIRRRGPNGETHVWALPYGGALGKVLLYRKDVFDAAGLAYPTKDWTWSDLLSAARTLSDPGQGRYGIAMARGRHESWNWIPFLWSAGGEVMTYDDVSDHWNIDFDSPAGVIALDFYTRLSTEPWTDREGRRRYGYVYKDTSEQSVKWDRAEIGMMFSYMDEKMFARINPDTTGLAPVPLGPTGLRGTELNSRMMGIYAGIQHPAVRDAAWEYIRFIDNEEAGAIRARILVEGGLGPFLNPRELERYGYSEVIRLTPRGWAETFRISIEAGKPEPYGRHSNVAYDLMTKPLEKAQQMALNGALPEDTEERYAILMDLLHESANKARVEMLGQLTKKQLRTRQWTALVVLAMVIFVFSAVFRRIIRTFTPPAVAGSAHRPTWAFSRFTIAYVLLIPAVATILMWQYFPLLRGSIMAFQDYRIMGNSEWAWLDNFGTVLFSTAWWQSVWNALRYSVLVISLTFLPPILLAIMLQEIPRGKMFFRTVFYLPAVITGLVVILLWKSFYDPSELGALNAVLMRIPAIAYLALGLLFAFIAFTFFQRLRFHGSGRSSILFLIAGGMLFYTCYQLAHPMLSAEGLPFWQRLFSTQPEPYRWLQDPDTAMMACVLPMVWAGMGPGCLIYLAALKGIADDFYEAADIDGATFVDKILFIVFPILKPLIIINFVGVFIGSWYGATDNILAMTGGGANTEVAGLHIFYQAFVFLKFGPATAMAWLLGLMLIGFTVYQLRILSRLEFRTTGGDQK